MAQRTRSRSLSEQRAGQSDEKGPAARRRPRAAREAYSLYVERAAEGANAADGPLSSLYGGSSNTSATDPYDTACTTLNDESRTSSAATSVTRSPIPMIHTRLARAAPAITVNRY